jgi:C-terminal processing protease CtpA/Prc
LLPSVISLCVVAASSQTLRLARSAQGFGFAVVGQSDEKTDAPGVFVCYINKKGPASEQGDMMIGQQLVRVDGIDVRDMSCSDVRQGIAQAGNEILLDVVNNEAGFAPYRKKAKVRQASIRKSEDRRKRKSKRQLQSTTQVRSPVSVASAGLWKLYCLDLHCDFGAARRGTLWPFHLRSYFR